MVHQNTVSLLIKFDLLAEKNKSQYPFLWDSAYCPFYVFVQPGNRSTFYKPLHKGCKNNPLLYCTCLPFPGVHLGCTCERGISFSLATSSWSANKCFTIGAASSINQTALVSQQWPSPRLSNAKHLLKSTTFNYADKGTKGFSASRRGEQTPKRFSVSAHSVSIKRGPWHVKQTPPPPHPLLKPTPSFPSIT